MNPMRGATVPEESNLGIHDLIWLDQVDFK